MTCFIDLDGVLADFVLGAFALHGRAVPYRDVEWGFPAQIGFAGANDPAFWSEMGHDFWASLPWTPEGKGLLAIVERHFGENVVVMTSPCDTPGGVEGKVAWIKRELPAYARRFFVGPPKHLAAGPGKLLIDDYEGNVEKFAAHGGATLLVPRPWNRRRGETDADGRFDVPALARELADIIAANP